MPEKRPATVSPTREVGGLAVSSASTAVPNHVDHLAAPLATSTETVTAEARSAENAARAIAMPPLIVSRR